jgi:hypothetical protein
MSTCRLCRASTDLRASHILPEFLYKPVYDRKHRFLVIGLESELSPAVEQKGLREPLLCDACEQHIGRFERYASQLFHHKKLKAEDDGHTFRFHGVDYAQFRLFLHAILWKAHASSLPAFRQVSLGSHAEVLRSWLLTSDPGPETHYRCFIGVPEGRMEDFERAIVPFYRLRLAGFRAYRVLFSGLVWTYLVSSRLNAVPATGHCISTDGVLPVHRLSKQGADRLLERLAKGVRKSPLPRGLT